MFPSATMCLALGQPLAELPAGEGCCQATRGRGRLCPRWNHSHSVFKDARGVASRVRAAKIQVDHSAAAASMCSGWFPSSEVVATWGEALSA